MEQALDQLVSLDCDETPWRSALADLSRQTGFPIQIDPEVDNDIAGAVSLKVKQVQLRSALGLLLEPLGLAYIPRGDHLEIAMPAKADDALIGRIYPVADLTTDPDFTERELADLIMAVISPRTRHTRGNRPGECVTKPGVLVISQSHQTHEAIARFLEDLRQHRDPQRPPRRQTPAEVAIEQALSSRVTLSVDRPWREVIAQLAQQQGLNLVIDEPRLRDVLGPPARPSRTEVPSSSPPWILKDVAFGLALDLFLEPLGCTWVIRHESLVVTTIDQAAQWLTLRLHPSSLPAAGHDPGNTNFRFLMENLGGLTSLGQGFTFPLLSQVPAFLMAPTTGSMAILGNRMRQDEIAALLPKLRQATDPLVVDYDERATSLASAKLWRTLDEPTTFDYSLQPFTLREVLDALARRHGGLNIFFRTRALEDAGVLAELDRWRPSLRAKGIRLASAISLLLKPLGLSWYARDNVLIVTSRHDAEQHTETRMYRAAYLGEGRELDKQTFVELVQYQVSVDNWLPGRLLVFSNPGVAAILKSRDVHDELRPFLHKLEAHLNPTTGLHDTLADTPAERPLYAALERPVTYQAVNRPLEQVFADLARQAGAENFIYNWRALEEVKLDRDMLDSIQVTQDFKNVPLHEALTAVGKPHDLVWTIDNEVLSITSRDDAENYVVRGFYRFPDGLFDPPGSSAPGPPADRYYYYEVLVEQIHTHFAPKAWQYGGHSWSSALPGGLVVTGPTAIQYRVRRFLNHLRYALADDFEVPKADRQLHADDLAGICTALGELARGPTPRLREVLDRAMVHADEKVRDAAKKALDKINRKPRRKKTP